MVWASLCVIVLVGLSDYGDDIVISKNLANSPSPSMRLLQAVVD